MIRLVKEILGFLNNQNTKVQLKKDFNGNYYSHITDTIYISDAFSDKKMPKHAQNINKKAAELIVLCHECIHSVQNKKLHILNTILSNLSIILTIICLVIGVLGKSVFWLEIVTVCVIIVGIIVRVILENGAINGSITLSKELVEKNKVNDITILDIEQSIKYINKYKCLALLRMVLDKITFLILILIIK